jgi:hypothetical protein
MPSWFDCPLLTSRVELTDERFGHIAHHHPELLPDHLSLIAETLADPDDMSPGGASNELVFRRWYHSLYGGKDVLVFVLRDDEPLRYWVVTSRLSRVRRRRGTP